jgi:hypothetical protein
MPRRLRRTRYKLSFPLPRVDYYSLFATPDARGLRHEQSSCILLTSKKIVKALVASWRSLSNTCQFSLQSHEARLTVGKAKILGRQANEKA